jgi:hypothetical protein
MQIQTLQDIGYSDTEDSLYGIPKLIRDKTLDKNAMLNEIEINSSSGYIYKNLHAEILAILISAGFPETSASVFHLRYESGNYTSTTVLTGVFTIRSTGSSSSTTARETRTYTININGQNPKTPLLVTQNSSINIDNCNKATSNGLYFFSGSGATGNAPFGLSSFAIKTEVVTVLSANGLRTIIQYGSFTSAQSSSTIDRISFKRIGTNVAPDGSSGTFSDWEMIGGEARIFNTLSSPITSTSSNDIPFIEFAKELRCECTVTPNNFGVDKYRMVTFVPDVSLDDDGNTVWLGSLSYDESPVRVDGNIKLVISPTGSKVSLTGSFLKTRQPSSGNVPTFEWSVPNAGAIRIRKIFLTRMINSLN